MARSVSVVNISIDLQAVRALGACAGCDAQRARQAVYLRLAVQRAGHFAGFIMSGRRGAYSCGDFRGVRATAEERAVRHDGSVF